MTPPPITAADIACAKAGDMVGPEDAAWFLGETMDRLAYWRKRKGREGPPFTKMGPHLIRYAMADLLAWRMRPVR